MNGVLVGGMINAGEDCLNRANKFDNPYLMLLGGKDTICDPEFLILLICFRGGKLFFNLSHTPDNKKKLIAHGVHFHD